jgi:hypothetical protein
MTTLISKYNEVNDLRIFIALLILLLIYSNFPTF